MKLLFLPLLLGFASVSGAQAKPAAPKKLPTSAKPISAKPISAMPAEVGALFPKGATSLYLDEMPMGVGGKRMLVHLWAAGREPSPGASHQFSPSPFCVDVFEKDSKGSDTQGKWSRVNSTVYTGEDGPSDRADVSVRWLYALEKQGPVLVIVSPSYIATRYTVITYPKGFEDSVDSESYVQDFYQGGVGGGKILYDFGVDKRGVMAVVMTDSVYGRIQSTKVLEWNGHEYTVSSSKPK